MDLHFSYLNDLCGDNNLRAVLEDREQLNGDVLYHIEALCDLLQINFENKYEEEWSSFCRKQRVKCLHEVRCKHLRGETGERTFISTMIHILQDYGLFQEYLKMDIDPKWSSEELIHILDIKLNTARIREVEVGGDQYQFCQLVLKRARNIEFLRRFDIYCCNRHNRTPHLHFVDRFINIVRNHLKDYEEVCDEPWIPVTGRGGGKRRKLN
jgi:hypothetical protein